MNEEEMKIAASTLFSLLGRQGDEHYSVDPATGLQVATLIVDLTPRIHAVVYNKGRRLGLEYLCSMDARQEIAAEVAMRLLRLEPALAARVRDPWAYFHTVVLNAINDFKVPATWRGDDDVQDLTGGDQEDAAGAGAGEGDHDSTLGGAHARRAIEKLERMLHPDDFKALMLKAEGYSTREIIALVQGIPQAAVTSQQEGALRQHRSELIQHCHHILGGNL